MSHLYTLQFDSGHIKVGRSSGPEARVAQHVARVACVGISLTDSRIFACAGDSITAEAMLVNWCAQRASRQLCREWFEGLAFEHVVSAADEFSKKEFARDPLLVDSMLIDQAGGTGTIAEFCGTTQQAVTNWKARGIPDGWRKFLALAKPEIFADKAPA